VVDVRASSARVVAVFGVGAVLYRTGVETRSRPVAVSTFVSGLRVPLTDHMSSYGVVQVVEDHRIPRYYFHIEEHGQTIVVREGIELANLDAAREQAAPIDDDSVLRGKPADPRRFVNQMRRDDRGGGSLQGTHQSIGIHRTQDPSVLGFGRAVEATGTLLETDAAAHSTAAARRRDLPALLKLV
jgi:hypothetical protein